MEQVTEYEWEDIVRYASEVGLVEYSVRPVAVQRNVWIIGMALCSTWCSKRNLDAVSGMKRLDQEMKKDHVWRGGSIATNVW